MKDTTRKTQLIIIGFAFSIVVVVAVVLQIQDSNASSQGTAEPYNQSTPAPATQSQPIIAQPTFPAPQEQRTQVSCPSGPRPGHYSGDSGYAALLGCSYGFTVDSTCNLTCDEKPVRVQIAPD